LGKDPDKRLAIRESKDKGIFIEGINFVTSKGIEKLLKAMTKGNKSRHTGETAMNAESSRSHSIFTLYLETSEMKEGQELYKAGKLNLVDLAGSERQNKTQATGIRLTEANNINLSLTALGNVISALVDGKSKHIPYRDSKLTRLL
jgi:kinesin family protein 3/17